jgi:hypothetical protein
MMHGQTNVKLQTKVAEQKKLSSITFLENRAVHEINFKSILQPDSNR